MKPLASRMLSNLFSLLFISGLAASLSACATALPQYAGCAELPSFENQRGTAMLVGEVRIDDIGEGKDSTIEEPSHFIIWEIKPVKVLRNSLGPVPNPLKVITLWHEFPPSNEIIDRIGGYVEPGTISAMVIKKHVKHSTQEADYEIVTSEVCAELPRTNLHEANRL